MQTYDVVIVGAGIHGAACAETFTRAGYSVLILEKYAQAGLATSSKSSKLIHGGLRYLESGQFRLVYEALHERNRLLKRYPDLVKPLPFIIPVYRSTVRRPLWIRLGLVLYSLLSLKAFSMIRRADWSHLDGLETSELQTVFRYLDAQTDDGRLTQRIIDEACKSGARFLSNTVFEFAQVASLVSGQLWEINYSTQGVVCQVRSRYLLNASGPWVNHVLDNIKPKQRKVDIELVAGTHILVPGRLEKGAYYLESPVDQRAVFVMPWQGNTLVGTTETVFDGQPDELKRIESDIDYLLELYNHYFRQKISRADVLDDFIGLRVLPAATSSVFSRNRETIMEITSVDPVLINIYGGKLTTHHLTAQRALKLLKSST